MTLATNHQLGPLIVGIEGLSLTASELKYLQHPAIGGVILFSRNYQSRDQLKALCAQIKAIRHPRLLICVDQEGGVVQRFREGFTPIMAAQEIGELYAIAPQLARELSFAYGQVMAKELKAVGVDLSLAPVLDVNTAGNLALKTRAWSYDGDVVSILGKAFCCGMQSFGMKAVGKHFPGHGAIRTDTHHQEAVDSRSWHELMAVDLAPYKECQEYLGMVMMSHVIYDQIDCMPAGFSKRWIQDILKNKLGYQGLVISDDLGMQACLKRYLTQARAVQAALDAGCDVVLVCNDLAQIPLILDHVKWTGGADLSAKLQSLSGQEERVHG